MAATTTRTFVNYNRLDHERHEPLINALRCWRFIEGRRRVSLPEIASEVGVCERSVRRYLRALEYAGFAVPEWRKRESA